MVRSQPLLREVGGVVSVVLDEVDNVVDVVVVALQEVVIQMKMVSLLPSM